MPLSLITGATGAGKTTALLRRYQQWVAAGIRTDEILVLTADAAQASRWRDALGLERLGKVEATSYFGFLQRELTLFWATIQQAQPVLAQWQRPEFLNVEVAHHLMRGLVDDLAANFAVLKASPQRIASQLASNLATVGASSGLTPDDAVQRLQAVARKEHQPVFDTALGALQNYRELCLQAGLLDYSLALELYQTVLVPDPAYQQHLRARYRHLVVDDLDETVPAEQDFLAAVAGLMTETAMAWSSDGGHRTYMGADAQLGRSRFVPETVEELPGSHTCSPTLFQFGAALAARILGEKVERRFDGVVEQRIATELRGDMLAQVLAAVQKLLARGVAPGDIAIITPHVDQALTIGARRLLGGVPVQNLSLSRRLLDEPHARAIVTLAALVHPQWQIPLRAGAVAIALGTLLKLDAVRAALLAAAVTKARDLIDLDAAGLRARIGFARAEAYDFLRGWVHAARDQVWETDTFAQAVVAELMMPLLPEIQPEQLHVCQQLLTSAHRFRQAMERMGPATYGEHYIKMLTEGTVAAESLEDYEAQEGALLLTTPFAYLGSRHVSRYQFWLDTSSAGWYPSDAKELANPHVLSRRWTEGDRWNDRQAAQQQRVNAARTVRALARRCKGRLIVAESGLNLWGMEQAGGLSDALADLVREGVGAW